MEAADILFVEEKKDGVFLCRYTATGNFAGDTWHANVEDAKDQAEFEFDGLISPWVDVPSEVTDVVEFALRGYSS
jgi:hypothetical protein